jgi:hypothetical protein
MKRVFMWGTLVTGAYGVYQYWFAPEWDTAWMINTELTTIGNPEPFGIRVWSTMNGPFDFAMVTMAGLLLLLNHQLSVYIPASIAGYLAFLLTQVRSAWVCWLMGLFTLIMSLKDSLRLRISLTIMIVILCVYPLTTIPEFSAIISARVDTLSNLQDDYSGQVRQSIYEVAFYNALTNPVGQ